MNPPTRHYTQLGVSWGRRWDQDGRCGRGRHLNNDLLRLAEHTLLRLRLLHLLLLHLLLLMPLHLLLSHGVPLLGCRLLGCRRLLRGSLLLLCRRRRLLLPRRSRQLFAPRQFLVRRQVRVA